MGSSSSKRFDPSLPRSGSLSPKPGSRKIKKVPKTSKEEKPQNSPSVEYDIDPTNLFTPEPNDVIDLDEEIDRTQSCHLPTKQKQSPPSLMSKMNKRNSISPYPLNSCNPQIEKYPKPQKLCYSARVSPYLPSPKLMNPQNKMEPPLTPLEPREVSIFEKLEFLKKYTHYKKMEIIYNSDVDGFETRALNSKIRYQSNLVFIIITNNEQFGFYTSDIVNALNNETTQVTSNEMFLFVLNGKGAYPFKLERKDTLRSFTVFQTKKVIFFLLVFAHFGLHQMDNLEFINF
ncbi:hypothetical protein KM1_056570 [Entamoeba histolytica HM-3:IMSS]|uniref:TLDc domain-containing protein n=1 Tax=Entamoeba histolytica HM-3:IMSS TaxID=885315 RepID=M7WQY4_ENTHI|nr:hypothetical protein KM1_056570 [Entamoeba histolytica HM-3:IMSS]